MEKAKANKLISFMVSNANEFNRQNTILWADIIYPVSRASYFCLERFNSSFFVVGNYASHSAKSKNKKAKIAYKIIKATKPKFSLA